MDLVLQEKYSPMSVDNFYTIEYNPELIDSYVNKIMNLNKYDYPVVNEYGDKRWYNENGELHRLDGPALIYRNGTQIYYQNGLLHRLDGPAIIWSDGFVEYWEYGKQIS